MQSKMIAFHTMQCSLFFWFIRIARGKYVQKKARKRCSNQNHCTRHTIHHLRWIIRHMEQRNSEQSLLHFNSLWRFWKNHFLFLLNYRKFYKNTKTYRNVDAKKKSSNQNRFCKLVISITSRNKNRKTEKLPFEWTNTISRSNLRGIFRTKEHTYDLQTRKQQNINRKPINRSSNTKLTQIRTIWRALEALQWLYQMWTWHHVFYVVLWLI